MKRINYYILFLTCWLCLGAYGQNQQENYLRLLRQYDVANKMTMHRQHAGSDRLGKLMTTNSNEPGFVIEIGSYSDGFEFTHTQDTDETYDAYRPSGWQWDESPNDVFYCFTVETPMAVIAQTTPGACVYIEPEDLNTGELMPFWGGNVDPNIFIAILPIGTYYVISEGFIDDNGMISNGEIVTNIYASSSRLQYGLGTFTENIQQTIIGDTRRASTEYGDKYRNDIYYYLDLKQYMNLSVFLSDSEFINDFDLSDVNLYLLDGWEKEIASSKNGRLEVEQLSPGSYYLVVEGRHDDGIFSLDLELTTIYHELHPDIGNNNYILTRTYTEADEAENRINIDYYDGLGRPSESILVGASPLGKDIVTRQDYDSFGRPSCEWLPRVSEYSNGKYLAPIEFVKISLENYDNDSHLYSKTVYEDSPLNRMIEQYGPGADWYNNEKSNTTAYKTNVFGDTMLNAKHYIVGGTRQSPILSQSGNYATGQLYVTEMKDEDGNISYEFKDKLGLVVLTRQMAGRVTHDTYYVYDDFGKRCFVLPPRVDDEGITQTKLDEFAYQYKYDVRGRCVAKKLPGCEWVYSIYDKADRLIFSQDGNQRRLGEWSFNIPDHLGRIVLTGTCTNMQDYLFSPLVDSIVKGVWNNTTNLMKGYDIIGVTLSNPVILSVNYYDSYDFLGRNGIPDSTSIAVKYEQDQNEFGKQYTESSQGLLTGTLTALLTDQDSQFPYLCAVMYYDYNGRLVQTKSANHLLNGVDKDYFAYNFIGETVRHKHVHSVTGKTPQMEIYNYTYDHAGRLSTTTHQLNEGMNVTLVDNEYDELGRLVSNKRNGQSNLKTEYAYNIRSWTESISSSLFSQNLSYTNGIGTPCYNGNISSMSWKTSIEPAARGYCFEYDPLSRLKNAVYGEGEELSLNVDRFSEQITGYDKNGNILGLKRYGQTSVNSYGLVDNLVITLNGNQLKSVDDSVSGSSFNNSFEFKDGTKQSVEYFYDANGNLLKDLNKKITDIQYNCLNLPNRIEFDGGSSISYLYDATGTKLRVVHNIAGNETTIDYCGNVIYENGIPKTLLTEAGYVSLTDNKYHYYLQDHQGNNRVVASQDGTVEELNHYYPFGGMFASTLSVQPYKYNGKELDRKGGLDWYDYGARHYDAALGRWHVVDPMVEEYYGLSPYNYCLNNPFRLIDFNGMWPGEPLLQPFGRYQYGSNVALNSFKFIHNTVAAVVNTPINIINQLADETQYIYNSGVGSYLSSATKGLGDVISSEFSYRVNTPISQQAVDTWQAMKEPQNWEHATATAALMLSPMKGGGTTGAGRSVSAVAKEGTITGTSAFRYMTEGELNAIQSTGLLRGGRAGETYWTKDLYKSASSAQNRLALPSTPTLRVEFEILNNPTLLRNGAKVFPANEMMGKGAEFMTLDPVRVNLINWQPLR